MASWMQHNVWASRWGVSRFLLAQGFWLCGVAAAVKIESCLQPLITTIQLNCGTFIQWLTRVAHTDESRKRNDCTIETFCRVQPRLKGTHWQFTAWAWGLSGRKTAWGGIRCLEFTKYHIDQPPLFVQVAALLNRHGQSAAKKKKAGLQERSSLTSTDSAASSLYPWVSPLILC